MVDKVQIKYKVLCLSAGNRKNKVEIKDGFVQPKSALSGCTGLSGCHTRVLGVQSPGANINTRCAGTKSHTYDA
jgi:hypothetical protein